MSFAPAFFIKKPERIYFIVLPFQIEPVSLGFDLVNEVETQDLYEHSNYVKKFRIKTKESQEQI